MACVICSYGYNVLRWIDQGINVVTGGDPRQTLSSRLGRAELAGSKPAKAFCAVLSWIFRDPGHCVNVIIPGDNAMESIDIDGKNDGP